MSPMRNQAKEYNMTTIWLGVAIGAAIGVGFAISRSRKRDRWSSAKDVTRKFSDHSGDLAEKSKDIIARAQNIYQEGRKIVEDATELWSHGRKLVGV
ncbi:MAG: YtxH domain-containing protein [Acidobacteria bacterium]|nr:YtxH domain-containing protein [Acidobacteriota bacterium]